MTPTSSPAGDAPSVGDIIDGKYELRRDLGEGAGGVVFEALHRFTGRSVAVKLVAPDVPRAKLGELRTRLVREARALAAVRHPGVVDVLDGGVLEDGTPYVVMENVEGRTLEGLITARGKLSLDDTVAVVLQLADALGAVHEAGVVHRDLKPSNVLITRDRDGRERVKLVDFGIAQLAPARDEEKLTSSGALIGTPAYMPPEQLLASDDVDARADIYALGVTAFECLTGSVPYLGTYPKVLMQVCGTGPPVRLPPESCSPELAAIVERAMARQREARFGDAGELARAIRALLPTAPERTLLLAPAPAPQVAQRPGQAPVEHRRSPRAAYATPIRITFPDGNVVDGRTEDISAGGLLAICQVACPSNVRVGLRFGLPIDGSLVSCEAHLRWVRSAGPDTVDGPRALGVEFIDPPAALRMSIARYVDPPE
jgi:serine/threonine protein kinase